MWNVARASEARPNGLWRTSSRRRASLAVALVAAFFLGLIGRTANAQEVTYELLSFGVGNAARPGDSVGVRVAVKSTATEVKTVEIVWIVPNADEDPIECSRIVNVAPGGQVERWLYARLPPNSNAQQVIQSAYQVRLYEVDAKHNRIADLYSQPMSGARDQVSTAAIDQFADLALIVGDSSLGLESYGGGSSAIGSGAPVTMNSPMIARDSVTPRDLCDHWKGLAPYSMMFWCDGRHSPRQLSRDEADAIREWVSRGGTLVIGLASDLGAEAWGLGREDAPPLAELLPSQQPTRHENVPISSIAAILSKSPIPTATSTTRVYTFDPKTLDRGYRPLVAIPARKDPTTEYVVRSAVPGGIDALDGAVVGVQRNFGYGQVIVLGIDVNGIHQRNLPGGPYPQADVFWNPILGKRGDVMTTLELQALGDANMILNAGEPKELGGGSTVSEYTSQPAKAAAMVLAAAALFAAYWLFSGPVGFVGLKQFKRERFSWTLFVVLAFLFTVVAWIGGVLLGQTTPSIKHLTVIDQLAVDPAQQPGTGAGAPAQRATCYFSAFLPNYDEKMISVGGDNPHNTLDSWAKPPAGTGDTYPNKLRYIVPSERDQIRGLTPASYRVPARATSADFIARWSGNVATEWGETIQVLSPVELRPIREGNGVQFQLVGQLRHRFPKRLDQVRVIVVTPRRNPLAALAPGATPARPSALRSGETPLMGYFWTLGGAGWLPDQPLDLSANFDPNDRAVGAAEVVGRLPPLGSPKYDLATNIAKEYREPLQDLFNIPGAFGGDNSVEARRRYLESLSLFSMLPPPEWLRRDDKAVPIRIGRMHARELDLGPWFTRPCVIIMGFIDEAPTPVPLQIDGRNVVSSGTTLYRWILPLDGYGGTKDASYQDFVVPEPRLVASPSKPATPAESEAAAAEPTASGIGPDGAYLNPDVAPSAAPGSGNPATPSTVPGRRRR